jgi:uncharacterized membrane protein YidH (DUF202 family)
MINWIKKSKALIFLGFIICIIGFSGLFDYIFIIQFSSVYTTTRQQIVSYICLVIIIIGIALLHWGIFIDSKRNKRSIE